MDHTKIYADVMAEIAEFHKEQDEKRLFIRGIRWTRAEQEAMRHKSAPPLRINKLPPLYA